MSAARFLPGLALGPLLGCAVTPQVAPPPPPPPVAPAPACARVPRAARIYTGFAQDVPPDRMYVALDAIRPLEQRLGELFCAPELAPCRPQHLLNIELADALPSQARVTLEGGALAAGRAQELVLRNVNERWEPDPDSLAALVAPCAAR